MTKAEVRTEVRRRLYEASADLWTNADIDAFIRDEIRTLPARNVYKEEIWEISTVVDQDDYTLPSGTRKVEKVQFDEGTSTEHDWQDQEGWDTFGGVLYLGAQPSEVETMRVFLRKEFTDPSTQSDGQTIDVPNDKLEIVYIGATLRAYQTLIGYFVDLKNWDYNAKPDGITMQQVQNWIRDVKVEYLEVLKNLRTVPRPRFIDLVN